MSIEAIEDYVVTGAAEAHRQLWSPGGIVSDQTKKFQRVCIAWQAVVVKHFGSRFAAEVCLNESGPAQKIDLVDSLARVA